MKKCFVFILILVLFGNSLHGYFYDGKEMASILRTGGFTDSSGNRIYASFLPGYDYAGNYMAEMWSGGLRIEKQGIERVGDGLLTMVTPSEYILPSFLYGIMGFGMGIGFGFAAPFYVAEYGYSDMPAAMSRVMDQADNTWQRESFGWYLAYPAAYLKNTVRFLVRTAGVATVSAVGVAGGIGVVAPVSLTLPAGALLINPLYGLGKTCAGILEFSNGLVQNHLVGTMIFAPAIYSYNTLAGAPFVLLTRQGDVQKISGNFMRLDLEAPDYEKKLAFEDSISLPLLSQEQENRLFSQVIDRVMDSSDVSAEVNTVDLLDGYRNSQQILADSLADLGIAEPEMNLEYTASSDLQSGSLKSAGDEIYLSEELQIAYAAYRIKRALADDQDFKTLPARHQQQIIETLAIKLKNPLSKNFSSGSQSANFWSTDILSELIEWVW